MFIVGTGNFFRRKFFHGFSSLFCNYAFWCTADNLINNQYYSQPWLQHGGTKCGYLNTLCKHHLNAHPKTNEVKSAFPVRLNCLKKYTSQFVWERKANVLFIRKKFAHKIPPHAFRTTPIILAWVNYEIKMNILNCTELVRKFTPHKIGIINWA